MRIGIQAWGSEGDIRPFLALGGALARAGHDVTLALTDLDQRTYEPYADALGVHIEMVARPSAESLAMLEQLGPVLIQKDPFTQGKLISERIFRPAVPEMFEAARALCARSDLVIGHYFHYPVRAAAELAGVPEVSVTLTGDIIASGGYPPTGLPALGAVWNRAWWGVAAWMMDRAFLPDINAFRRRAGLGAVASVRDAWHSRRLDLVAVSPTLAPAQPDWDARHRVTGFLTLPTGASLDPLPAEVEAFLGAGVAPVFVGFGSLSPKGEEQRAADRAMVAEAAREAGVRLIVQGIAPPSASTDNVLHVERLAHPMVFPRCTAVVHHGGAGTTHTVLRAGTPSVIVPHVADQFTWGALLHRAGVAPAPVRRTRLTASRLARAIRSAMDPAMRQRARELGARITAEDGAGEAVRLVHAVTG